jgi:hypothetical protein
MTLEHQAREADQSRKPLRKKRAPERSRRVLGRTYDPAGRLCRRVLPTRPLFSCLSARCGCSCLVPVGVSLEIGPEFEADLIVLAIREVLRRVGLVQGFEAGCWDEVLRHDPYYSRA